MSRGGGGGWGQRTSVGQKVTLHVYDLSPANDYIQPFGLGAYHSGVVIGGSEYTFAGGAGIFDHTPGEPGAGARFREAIDLGMFEGGAPALSAALSDLRPHFQPDSYNILTRNCNHLSDALCRRLLNGQPIPSYVNRLANLGACFSSCLPEKLLGGGPQHGGGGGGGSGGGYEVLGGGGRSMNRGGGGLSSSSTAAFSGSGMVLGHSGSSSSGGGSGGGGGGGGSGSAGGGSNGSGSSNDLQDRRERVRQATLARMGMS